jgi:hypothetical protein
MIKLPCDHLAAFSLGVMTTVLLLAPAGKAYCIPGSGMSSGEFVRCLEQENRMDELELQQRQIQHRQDQIETQQGRKAYSAWRQL